MASSVATDDAQASGKTSTYWEKLAAHLQFALGSTVFALGTTAHTVLSNRIVLEIGRLSGVDLRAVRKEDSVVVGHRVTCIWAPLGYVIYLLDRDGFDWLSFFPAIPAAVFSVAALALVIERKEERVSDEEVASSSA